MSKAAREGAIAVVVRALDARTRRYAALFGVVHLADRIALLTIALMAPREDHTGVAVAAVVFGSLTLVRAIVGSLAQGHAQSALHVRVGDALMTRDLFRASVLDEDDPEAALLEGLESGVRVAVSMLPATIADCVGSVVVAIVLVRIVEPTILVAGLIAVVGAAFALLVSRRITVRAAENTWSAHRLVLDRLVAILGGRLELVANAADGAMRVGLERAAEQWRVAIARFERASAVTGRMPLLLGAGLLVGVLFASSSVPARDLTLHAVILAAALPPFAGAIRGVHDLTKVSVRIAPLARLIADPSPERKANAEMPAPRTLAFDGVSYRYTATASDALHRATCELARGTITVLVGPNGCGKSTFLRMLLGIEAAREGAVLVDGVPLGKNGSALRNHVAYLPQRPYLSDRFTAREAFALLAPSFEEAAAISWLERIGLLPALRAKNASDPLAVRVGELSSGQKQRLALARLGVLDRPIWLLDEPDVSIDAEGLARLETILDEDRSGRLVVIAAHAPGLRKLADRVISMNDGILTDEARPSGMFP